MKFVRRHIIIRTLQVEDIEDYYYEFPKLSKTERDEKIRNMEEQLQEIENDIDSTAIFAVSEKDTKKLIGLIYGKRKGKLEEISVSIPNQSKLYKYGCEVIDQFLKVCKERWANDIKFVKLNEKDAAAKIYMKEKDLESDYITVA